MALIGFRSPLTYHPWPWSEYTEAQKKMFNVRPGITGWAQVNGRKTVEWNKRIELNGWYAEHVSFWLDVKILFELLLDGTVEELCLKFRKGGIPYGFGGIASLEHLVYASSSSVYGTNKKIPYSTDDKVDNPVSLYAATKKSNELMAHAFKFRKRVDAGA